MRGSFAFAIMGRMDVDTAAWNLAAAYLEHAGFTGWLRTDLDGRAPRVHRHMPRPAVGFIDVQIGGRTLNEREARRLVLDGRKRSGVP